MNMLYRLAVLAVLLSSMVEGSRSHGLKEYCELIDSKIPSIESMVSSIRGWFANHDPASAVGALNVGEVPVAVRRGEMKELEEHEVERRMANFRADFKYYDRQTLNMIAQVQTLSSHLAEGLEISKTSKDTIEGCKEILMRRLALYQPDFLKFLHLDTRRVGLMRENKSELIDHIMEEYLKGFRTPYNAGACHILINTYNALLTSAKPLLSILMDDSMSITRRNFRIMYQNRIEGPHKHFCAQLAPFQMFAPLWKELREGNNDPMTQLSYRLAVASAEVPPTTALSFCSQSALKTPRLIVSEEYREYVFELKNWVEHQEELHLGRA